MSTNEHETSHSCYPVPSDGIQARYRLSGGEWSSWGHVTCGVKGHEMELRAINFYPDRRACTHPSWEDCGNGKWRCSCCNVIGEEHRYLQPDGELDRVYDRATRDQRQEVTDDECDKIVAQAMDDVAQQKGMHALELNADITINHTLRRAVIRAAFQSVASPIKSVSEALNFLEEWALSGGKLEGDDIQRVRATVERIAPIESPVKVPDGWKLVPIDANSAMKAAGGHANSEWLNDNAPLNENRYGGPVMKSVWDAMLAAAPEYKP